MLIMDHSFFSFKSESDRLAGTVACQTYIATIQGTQLALIDCPGLNGDNADLVKIGWIGRYICDLFRHGRSLHGILYLHDINVVRETPAMERCLKFVEVITETAGYPNITFVTTKWDGLNQSRRIVCNGYHNNLTNCRQWQTFRSHGARDSRHDGLDDLPNPPNAALQAAQASLLNVLQFYLNNPGRMPLRLETQFHQRNQDIESTIQWLLPFFGGQQTAASTDNNNNNNNNKGSFPDWVIPVALVATVTGAFVYNQEKLGYIRGRPTWDGMNKPGFKIYYDGDKKAKFYESCMDDIYREQRNKNPILPEGRPSKLFHPKPLHIDVNNPTGFRLDPEPILNPKGHSTFSFDKPSYLNTGGRSSLSGLGSNPRLFQFDTGGLPGFGSSDRSNLLNLSGGSSFTSFNSGGRFSSNGMNFK
jgi:hypothetical protein